METSDSECFESADEDFFPDTEEKTVKSISPTQNHVESTTTSFTNLTVNDDDVSKSDSFSQPSVQEHKTEKTEKREKQTRPKLGVKLGTKLKKTECTFETPKEERHDDGHFKETKDPLQKSKFTITSGSVSNKNEEVNMWEDDEWEPITDVNDKLLENTENKNISKDEEFNSSWGGWGSWGVSSLLSTATVGVTTLTNHVSHGITTVLESGIGAPEPEELARSHNTDKEETHNTTTSHLGFGLENLVSGVTQITKLVETTGNKVISGGLDTLETIGKKTMQVLQEGDPGLKKKRAFLKIDSNKPILSQVLREAKEKVENDNKLLVEKHFSRRANYEMLFDDHQGLVHLEALEMLSKQCDIKLQTLLETQSGKDLIELQETLSQINELCELNEEDEEEEFNLSEISEKLKEAVAEMNVAISYNKLTSIAEEAQEWLENVNLSLCSELELHEQAIDTLAQLTAVAVEQFHKIGELLLIKEHRSTADEADSLVQLTMTITMLISHIAIKFSNKLSEALSISSNKEKINGLITNVYFESANSSSYIKSGFQLLIPVLQVGAT